MYSLSYQSTELTLLQLGIPKFVGLLKIYSSLEVFLGLLLIDWLQHH